jgi:hypothetical protein
MRETNPFPPPRKLTRGEQNAIERLRVALRRWPKTLGFHAGTGGLNVMMLDPETESWYHANRHQWDQGSVAETFNVTSDGGDPW